MLHHIFDRHIPAIIMLCGANRAKTTLKLLCSAAKCVCVCLCISILVDRWIHLNTDSHTWWVSAVVWAAISLWEIDAHPVSCTSPQHIKRASRVSVCYHEHNSTHIYKCISMFLYHILMHGFGVLNLIIQHHAVFTNAHSSHRYIRKPTNVWKYMCIWICGWGFYVSIPMKLSFIAPRSHMQTCHRKHARFMLG